MNYATKFLDVYQPRLGIDIKSHDIFKNPLLIVGANQYTRTLVKWNVLQTYDIHFMFQPHNDKVWTIGAILLNRKEHDVNPIILSVSDKSVQQCFKILGQTITNIVSDPNRIDTKINSKLATWYLHWIYRSPKISLKDVLHLETYK
jgi:hypothetical protein